MVHFSQFFLMSCQSNCCLNDTDIIWCSIPYKTSHRCSVWGLSSHHIIAIIIWTWKREKQVLHHCQGETLISEHLHSPPCSAGSMKGLPRGSLIGWHRKADTLLMHKTISLSPSPSKHCHTQLVALEGSPLCSFRCEGSIHSCIQRDIGHSKCFSKNVIHVIFLKWMSCFWLQNISLC